MKIAVIKLGARITWETDAAVGPGEAISICKALTLGGAEVHVFTKLLTKDTLDPSLVWHNLLDDTDTGALDALLIINGNVNFFGGQEDEAQILNYKIINQFAGTVVYVMCDPELPLCQIWDSVSKKPWGSKYNEADVNITRLDINVLSQPFSVPKVLGRWTNKKGTAPVARLFHFPMERFPLLNEWLDPKPAPEIDLLYGGTTRGGRRVPNLFKWYYGMPESIKTEIFGSIDHDDFVKHTKINQDLLASTRAPDFTGMVKYRHVLPKMNNSLAHLVTGDPSYEELDIIPQRTYECIAAGNVVFVDAAMDISRRIYPAGDEMAEFLYVNTRAELIDRITALKEDSSVRQYVLDYQKSATNFNAVNFCTSLVQKIKSLETYPWCRK